MQNTIILLIEQIVVALGGEFKLYLPQLIPHMLRVFMHDNSTGRSVTIKVSATWCSSDVSLPSMYLNVQFGIEVYSVWVSQPPAFREMLFYFTFISPSSPIEIKKISFAREIRPR